MDRVFLDANVLFSAAYKAEARVGELWNMKDVSLWTSRYAWEEARINLEEEDQQKRLLELSEALHFGEAGDDALPVGVRLPEKDEPILQAAIATRAHYLLTGDVRHFGPYLGKRIAGVRVSLPVNYLKARNKRRSV